MCVILKAVKQPRRRCRSVQLFVLEAACDNGLERRGEAILGATGEAMQMTPHQPEEAVRFDQRWIGERDGPP